MKASLRILFVIGGSFLFSGSATAQTCVDCHRNITPAIVLDWRLSKHSQAGMACSSCHGDEHISSEDVAKAKIPTPETCGTCHEVKFQQLKRGKHALAWSAMKAMPTFHWQPMPLAEGMKGCDSCHKIGLKTADEIAELKRGGQNFGIASCDSCHTRHTFFPLEAKQPQACRTCHAGYDHPQWEMYSSSKHGVRYSLKQTGILLENVAAPTCHTCHMPEGNHEVRTAWGFLGLRLPLPEDPVWAANRTTILQALGLLDPDGKPTPRMELMKQFDVFRLSDPEWQRERDQMLRICHQCHSLNFARQELARGDELIREADRLMAEAIRLVAALYREGVLPKPARYAAFPDLFAFHDAPSVVEQRLFIMFLEHRSRTFQGAFHSSPDYAFRYGLSEMQRNLTEIKARAEELRRAAGKKP